MTLKTDENTRDRGRRMMVLAFLAAAGCKEYEYEDYARERADLECDLHFACERVSDERACSGPEPHSDCERFHPGRVDACLAALEDAIDEAEEDPSACPNDEDWHRACADVVTFESNGNCAIGRPLLDGEGTAVLASVEFPAVLPASDLATDYWTQAARYEHASISAFSRLAQELLALDAPLDLVEASHRAALDEARHTRICLELVGEICGERPRMGALPLLEARRDVDIETLALESLEEGCIGETMAAVLASIATPTAASNVAVSLRQIATDEFRHADLGWGVVRWALTQRPGLARVLIARLEQRIEQHRRAPCVPGSSDLHWGVSSPARVHAVQTETYVALIRPTLRALIESSATARSRHSPRGQPIGAVDTTTSPMC